MTLNVDGIAISNMGTTTNSGAAWSTFSLNPAAVQEMSFETDANSAESASDGVRVNVIPREAATRSTELSLPMAPTVQWRGAITTLT
jgi:hypothetical protein